MLKVQHLRKEYRPLSGRPMLAIDDISFSVERGRFVSIVGPSGCGKSTLLMCVAGLARPSAGKVYLAGTEVTGPPKNLTVLFQEYNKSLPAWRSVLKNVRLGLEGRGAMARAEIDARARLFLDLVGLRA